MPEISHYWFDGWGKVRRLVGIFCLILFLPFLFRGLRDLLEYGVGIGVHWLTLILVCWFVLSALSKACMAFGWQPFVFTVCVVLVSTLAMFGVGRILLLNLHHDTLPIVFVVCFYLFVWIVVDVVDVGYQAAEFVEQVIGNSDCVR